MPKWKSEEEFQAGQKELLETLAKHADEMAESARQHNDTEFETRWQGAAARWRERAK